MSMLCAVLAAGLIPNAFAEREIHVWTDANGVRYFAEVPPADTETETIETDPAPPFQEQAGADATIAAPEARQSAAETERRAIAEAAQKQQDAKSENLVLCDRHRKRLEQMLPARRVYYRDEDGNEVRMDDTQRVALIEESREFVSENCH
jgi:hypothetical protein